MERVSLRGRSYSVAGPPGVTLQQIAEANLRIQYQLLRNRVPQFAIGLELLFIEELIGGTFDGSPRQSYGRTALGQESFEINGLVFHHPVRNDVSEFAIGIELLFVEELIGGALVGEIRVFSFVAP